MTRRIMSQVETVKMSQLMAANIRSVPVDEGVAPMCEYINGYDDERTAREIAPDLKASHAYGLRKNLFGTLTTKRVTVDEEMVKRVADLEQLLMNLVQSYHELAQKHDKLCMGISLARVGVDCKHLIVTPRMGANT